MQTYTHYVLTDFLGRKIQASQAKLGLDPSTTASLLDGSTSTGANLGSSLPPWRNRAALLGSVAPDTPLIAAFLLFLALDLLSKQSNDNHTPDAQTDESVVQKPTKQSWVGYLFGTLFFKDWRMKFLHNLFHAPILTLLYVGLGYGAWRWGKSWGAELFWFGMSCMLHTAIDVPLHYDDGPLLLFPFDWEKRYYSPVSYWDTRRHGGQFRVVEHALLFILLLWLIYDWLSHR
ncbi:MAG: hypothetical protein AAF702_12710 [Chloroflexota bacterium]